MKKKVNRKKFLKNFNNKQKAFLIILIIIFLVLVGLIIHKVFIKYILVDEFSKTVENKPKDKLENYNYYLSRNATDYEENLFKELKKVLLEEVVSKEKYVTVLSKLFISDLFTLNTKKSSSDVTSSQYVHSNYQEIYIEKVKNTIYSNIEINIDNTRKQKLPVVTDVEVVDIEDSNFKIENTDMDAYQVIVNITYEEDLGYPTKYHVILVKNNNLLQVVKVGETI